MVTGFTRAANNVEPPFEVSGDKGAKFCKNACRFKAYRSRQAQAKQFAKAGMSMSKIAEELNTEVETVKGWIK